MPHPAVWAAMSTAERVSWSITTAGMEIDWRVIRVADLTNIDPETLDMHVEGRHGWEPHDDGYLHAVVRAAACLLEGSPCG